VARGGGEPVSEIEYTEKCCLGHITLEEEISVWVNEHADDCDEPHIHVRMLNGEEITLRITDLSPLDDIQVDDDTIQEIKTWLRMMRTEVPIVPNIEFVIGVWNAQEGHGRKVGMGEVGY
jgi:hypothetical protein